MKIVDNSYLESSNEVGLNCMLVIIPTSIMIISCSAYGVMLVSIRETCSKINTKS